jgi:hypothetical protein
MHLKELFNNFIMKNKFSLQTAIGFVLAFLFSVGAFAQVADVGQLQSGKPVVTSLSEATKVLKGGLSTSATVSDIYIDLETSTGKYFLIGKISNDRVSGKAVELKLEGDILRAKGGPGVEVTCVGTNCDSCIPKITKGKVRCVCDSPVATSSSKCDMISKVVLTLW